MNAMVAIFLLLVVLGFAFYMYGDVIMGMIDSFRGDTSDINMCANWAIRECETDYYGKNEAKIKGSLDCSDYDECKSKCPECGVYA